MSNINSRVRLLDRPLAVPGKCAICGAVDRKVIDIGFNLDYYGAVYFCVICIKEITAVYTEDEFNIDSSAINNYLAAHDLIVVPKEKYDRLIYTISDIEHIISRFSVATPILLETVEVEPTEPDNSTDDAIGINLEGGIFTSVEGSASVPSDTVSGEFGFN